MDLFSYKGKHIQKSDRKYMRNAIPLFLGMLICMSCLAGGTLAWFNANRTALVQHIQSAEYSVTVEVNDTSGGTPTPIEVIVEENVASCTLASNTSYSLKLTPTGTATKGYCLITDGDNVYRTGQLLVETTFEFTYNNGLDDKFETAEDYDELINNTPGRNFAIAWYWGEYPNTLSQITYSMEEPILIENGSVIGKPIAERPEEDTEPLTEPTTPDTTEQETSSTEETVPPEPGTTPVEGNTTQTEPSVSTESATSSTKETTSTEPNTTTSGDSTTPTDLTEITEPIESTEPEDTDIT